MFLGGLKSLVPLYRFRVSRKRTYVRTYTLVSSQSGELRHLSHNSPRNLDLAAPASDVKWILVDANNNTDIMELSQTKKTVVNSMGNFNFNVRVEGILGVEVTSVAFPDRNEGQAPFMYCGDKSGDYKTCKDWL